MGALYPNLTPTGITVSAPSGTAIAGGALAISWNDANVGRKATTGPWTDSVVIENLTTGQTLGRLSIPAGGTLAPGANSPQSAQFTLPNGAAGAGQIRVTVNTDSTNVIFEDNGAGGGENDNSAAVTLTAQPTPYPDLVVANPSIDNAAALQSGDAVTVRWADHNVGRAAASASWYDTVTLSNSTTGKTLGTVSVLYDATAAGALAVDASASRTATFQLPKGDAGAGDLVATITADAFNQVFEQDAAGNAENNNVATATVHAALAPYADLAVSNVTAPALTVADPAYVTIGWTVANLGTAVASGPWVDSVVASPDGDTTHGVTLAQFTHSTDLAAGASYTQSQTILLPPGFSTDAHLIVVTDRAGAVFENGRLTNNHAEAPNRFDVTPKPYADLQVTSLRAPSAGVSGAFLDISWSVANLSPNAIGATDTTSWSDTVALASDAAGQHIITTLGAFSHAGALEIGGGYQREVQAPVPITVSGTYYVVVTTGGPYEFIYTTNNSAVSGPVAIAATPGPDLAPVSVTATQPGSSVPLTSLTAGDSFDVTWTVRNAGGSPTDASWIDALVLTHLGTTNSAVVGAFSSSAALDGGRDITRTERVSTPSTLAGQFQLSLITNAGLFPIYETSHANDTLVSSSPLTVLPLPRPDLQVASIDQAPATIASGGTVSLSYTVINQGPAEASGHWKDAVYLSYVNHLDSSAILIGTLDNPEALVNGQTYTTPTGDLAVPKRLGGNAYLIVATNSNGAVNEADATNDTIVKPIYITPEPPADLVASQVVAPDQAVDGSTFAVTYHVANLGLEATDKTTWTDTIWLTHDKTRPNPSKGDVLLATVVHNGALGDDPSVITQPTSYDNTVTVTLPKHISGQYFITAWTDTLDAVYKSTQNANVNPDDPTAINSDNFKARAISILPSPPADLVVTSVSPQAVAVGGDDYKVVWTVKN